MDDTIVKCISCGCDTNVEEFYDVSDASICPYCFIDRLNEIQNKKALAGMREADPVHKLNCIKAECELRAEHAADQSDTETETAYRRIIRLIEA